MEEKKYDMTGMTDAAPEEGTKSQFVENVASETVDSKSLPSWLLDKLSSIGMTLKEGAGAGLGGITGGVGMGLLTKNPRAIYAGSVAGAGAGQGVQDYLEGKDPSLSSSGGSALAEAIGGPLAVGAKHATMGLLRRTPGLSEILGKLGLMIPDLKAAANLGPDIPLPRTQIESIMLSLKPPTSLVPSKRTLEEGVLDNLYNDIGKYASAGVDVPPAVADRIRASIGKLQEGGVSSETANILYKAIMNDLRVAAELGSSSASKLIQSGVETNAVNALTSGINRIPWIGRAGLGAGVGASILYNHPGYAAALAAGVPSLISGKNLMGVGIKNWNPYIGGASGGAVRGVFENVDPYPQLEEQVKGYMGGQ